MEDKIITIWLRLDASLTVRFLGRIIKNEK